MAISKNKITHSMVTILVALASFLFFGISFVVLIKIRMKKFPKNRNNGHNIIY